MRTDALFRGYFSAMPGEFSNLRLREGPQIEIQDDFLYRNKPFAESKVFLCSIENSFTKSSGDDVREIIEIEFSCQDIPPYDFTPGDSVAILPNNPTEEIEELIELLNIKHISNKNYELEILEGTKKKNAAIAKHLPKNGVVRDLFLKYIDIRGPPKKLFLKALLKYTENPEEHSTLELLSSPKGSKEYNKFIEENSSLLDVLKAFPSCRLPVEIILEHSTPLQPRYYSVASYPLKNGFKIMFDLIKTNNKLGICTGWLKNCITTKEKVPMYFRKPTKFRYEDISSPTILIATGTGVAPFMSFLGYKEVGEVSEIGDIWLYYGCRYKHRDNLCKNLENLIRTGCLNKLVEATSREDEKCYVQDKIKKEAKEIVDFIKNDGKIYVCGNKNMEKDVRETITECFVISKNINKEESEKIFRDLVKENRYIVDVWL